MVFDTSENAIRIKINFLQNVLKKRGPKKIGLKKKYKSDKIKYYFILL